MTLVISDGTVAQQGAHDELMAQPGIYRDFVQSRESSRGWSRRKVQIKEIPLDILF
jgi:ATP-binding cassette subfamily B protein